MSNIESFYILPTPVFCYVILWHIDAINTDKWQSDVSRTIRISNVTVPFWTSQWFPRLCFRKRNSDVFRGGTVLYAVTRFTPRLVAEAWSPGLAAAFSGSLVLFILISDTKFRPPPMINFIFSYGKFRVDPKAKLFQLLYMMTFKPSSVVRLAQLRNDPETNQARAFHEQMSGHLKEAHYIYGKKKSICLVYIYSRNS